MTEINLTPAERSKLRIFREIAAEARAEQQTAQNDQDSMRVVNGYVEAGVGQRVRNLCIPVRRAYLPSDPVSMRRVIELLHSMKLPEVDQHIEVFERNFAPIQQELDSASILNDRPVTHREMFETWIDSMVFSEIPDKRQPFLAMAQELGRAVEGIALHLAERIAERLLELDDVVADALNEPRGTRETSEGPA